MRYYFVAGEASGDLHAAHLMAAIRQQEAEAEFRFCGGQHMAAVAGTPPVVHVDELAYMGFFTVLRHLPHILRLQRRIKEDVAAYRPHVLVLVDYPGMNIRLAAFAHKKGLCPVFYYIAPKVWAWKERRVKQLKRFVNEMFCILPFEKAFFEHRHGLTVHYVGNPTKEEVETFLSACTAQTDWPDEAEKQVEPPLIALLPGSRKQEIRDNLTVMLQAAAAFPTHRVAIAGMQGMPNELYAVAGMPQAELWRNRTYELLHRADVAVVTSGTATLEAAVMKTPQLVCYNIPRWMPVRWMRKHLLKVPFISLVNLIAGKEVVKELVGSEMNAKRLTEELNLLIHHKAYRMKLLNGYEEMMYQLGPQPAAATAAEKMCHLLKEKYNVSAQRETKRNKETA